MESVRRAAMSMTVAGFLSRWARACAHLGEEAGDFVRVDGWFWGERDWCSVLPGIARGGRASAGAHL